MKIQLRRPPLVLLLILAGAIAVACAYSLYSGKTFPIQGRYRAGHEISRSTDPEGFIFMMRIYFGFIIAFVAFALIRVTDNEAE